MWKRNFRQVHQREKSSIALRKPLFQALTTFTRVVSLIYSIQICRTINLILEIFHSFLIFRFSSLNRAKQYNFNDVMFHEYMLFLLFCIFYLFENHHKSTHSLKLHDILCSWRYILGAI